jgi:hypothetical protein
MHVSFTERFFEKDYAYYLYNKITKEDKRSNKNCIIREITKEDID